MPSRCPTLILLLALALVSLVPSLQAQELHAIDQWAPAYPGEQSAVFTIRENLDTSQPFSVEIVSGPSKGTLEAGLIMRYTPHPGSSGDDSIVWRLINGDQVAEATLTMQIRDPADRQGDLIHILVNQSIYNELTHEVDRLAADLENEGYQAQVVPWPSSSSVSAVWEHLSSTYHDTIAGASGRLTGAILIGNMPRPRGGSGNHYNDKIYWNMHNLGLSSTRRHIWVSRISASSTSYGSQATLIRRALDANHAYRTGQSRLPHSAYVYCNRNTSNQEQHANSLLDVWSQVFALGEEDDRHAKKRFLSDRPDLNSAGADALVAGGEFFEEASHGTSDRYMSGAFRVEHLYRFIAQQRFILAQSCHSGSDGGIVNQHLFTRGGGAIFAAGGTDLLAMGTILLSRNQEMRNAAKSLLSQGETWGRTMQHAPFITMASFDRIVIYGDLSLPVRIAPPNALPTISSFTSSASRVEAGQPVTFTVNYEDVDATGETNAAVDFRHRMEWFLQGYNGGRNEPTLVSYCSQSATDKSASITYTYPQPGTYTVRVEVMDEWQARGWRELSIVVDPASSPASVTVEATEERVCVDSTAAWRFERSLSSNSLTVPLSFSGDAVIGDDVASLPETITFADGQSVVELAIPVLPNPQRSNDRNLIVNLVSGEGYDLGEPSSGSIIIEAMAALTRSIIMHPVDQDHSLIWHIDVDCDPIEDQETGNILFPDLNRARDHSLQVLGASQ